MHKRVFWVVMVSSLAVVLYTAQVEAATATGDQTMPQQVEKRSMGTEKYDIGPQRMDVKGDALRGTAPKPATETGDGMLAPAETQVDEAEGPVELKEGCALVVGDDGVTRMVCAGAAEELAPEGEDAVPGDGLLAQIVQQSEMGQQVVSEEEDAMEQQSVGGVQSEVEELPDGEGQVQLDAGCRLVADDSGNTRVVCADVQEESSGQLAQADDSAEVELTQPEDAAPKADEHDAGQLAVTTDAAAPVVSEGSEESAVPVSVPPGFDEVAPDKAVAPAPVKEDASAVTEDVPAVKEDASAVKEDVPAVKEDVPAVKEDVPAVKEDVPAVKEDVPAVKEDVPAVDEHDGAAVIEQPADSVTPLKEETAPQQEEAGAAGAMALFSNDEKGYSLSFPKDWEVRKGMMGLDVIAISPMSEASDSFRENINVVTEKVANNINLDAYYKAGVNALKQDIPGFEITETQDVTIDGVHGKRIQFKHSSGDVEAVVMQYILVEDGNQAILITAAVRSDELAKYRPIIDKVAQSLKLTKK